MVEILGEKIGQDMRMIIGGEGAKCNDPMHVSYNACDHLNSRRKHGNE